MEALFHGIYKLLSILLPKSISGSHILTTVSTDTEMKPFYLVCQIITDTNAFISTHTDFIRKVASKA